MARVLRAAPVAVAAACTRRAPCTAATRCMLAATARCWMQLLRQLQALAGTQQAAPAGRCSHMQAAAGQQAASGCGLDLHQPIVCLAFASRGAQLAQTTSAMAAAAWPGRHQRSSPSQAAVSAGPALLSGSAGAGPRQPGRLRCSTLPTAAAVHGGSSQRTSAAPHRRHCWAACSSSSSSQAGCSPHGTRRPSLCTCPRACRWQQRRC